MYHPLFIQNFAAEKNKCLMSKSILSLVALALIATISSCKKQVEEAHHAPLVKTTTATVNNLSENHNYPGIVRPQNVIMSLIVLSNSMRPKPYHPMILRKQKLHIKLYFLNIRLPRML